MPNIAHRYVPIRFLCIILQLVITVALYLDRELYFTTLLFMIYIVIIFFGFNSWLRNYRAAENKGEKGEREQRQTNE